MSFHLLNPWMLVGLAGVSLPIVAHLLSRRKFEVVEWAAMQFLDPGRRTRRRLRLEELLLLALRMAMVAMLAMVFARPWVKGGVFARLAGSPSRDIVVVFDGSYSLQQSDSAGPIREQAVQAIHDLLESMQTGDTFALIDAREQPRPVIDPPTRDLSSARRIVDALPPSAGSTDLIEACRRAVRILSRTSNVEREIIVVTDGQSVGWDTANVEAWRQLDAQIEDASVRPRLTALLVGAEIASQENLSVDRLELSRELTVSDFPIRIATKISRTGGVQVIRASVYLELDGQRLGDHTQSLSLEPDGEGSVEFEYRFPSLGSHVVTVSIGEDRLPSDNQSHAAVTVADALPVLLVEGDWQPDATRRESFFARAAVGATRDESPWLRASVIRSSELDRRRLAQNSVAVICGVDDLAASVCEALREFVEAGGGLLLAVGDKVVAEGWNASLLGSGLLPGRLDTLETSEDGQTLAATSLQLPFLAGFRGTSDGLTEARFTRWFNVVPVDEAETDFTVAARLANGAPYLLTHRVGRGQVMLMTSSLDADWNTLPAKPDYVALLHELVFYLSASDVRTNVEAGDSLLARLPSGGRVEDYSWTGPGELTFLAEAAGNADRRLVGLSDSTVPGIYRLEKTTGDEQPTQSFVVEHDRGESNLAPLSVEAREFLESDDRIRFVRTVDELQQLHTDTESRTELWHVGLLLFLLMLSGELALTRRLVRAGHVEHESTGDPGVRTEAAAERSAFMTEAK